MPSYPQHKEERKTGLARRSPYDFERQIISPADYGQNYSLVCYALVSLTNRADRGHNARSTLGYATSLRLILILLIRVKLDPGGPFSQGHYKGVAFFFEQCGRMVCADPSYFCRLTYAKPRFVQESSCG